MGSGERGVTLVELMVVVVVLAVLASIAVPSYRNYILRTNRSEAKSALLQLQAAQEKFYLQNNAYTDQVTAAPPAGLGLPGVSEQGLYSITVPNLGAGGQSFTASATPVAGAGQDADAKCTAFTIDNNGTRGATGPGGVADCWH